jgi:hypothetical protein
LLVMPYFSFYFKFDGVVTILIYRVVAHFCSFGIPHVWPHSQVSERSETPKTHYSSESALT